MAIDVRNPRTGRSDYSFEPPSTDDLDELALRLRDGQAVWEAGGLDVRTAALNGWRDAIGMARGEITAALMADTGRRVESEMEVDAALRMIERWCSLAPDLLAGTERRPASIPGIDLEQGMRPYPVAGVISPWNFPLLLALIDAVPALVAGCAVVIKPSEIAPRFIEPLAATVATVPAMENVVAIVAGDGSAGEAIVDRSDVVCFTGSVATGTKIAARAAKRFIPAFLELGGKDPAIVLPSADLDRASSAILWGSTANAGQSCQSIERVYVHESVFDDFVDRLVDKAKSVRLAVPEPDAGDIGPIIAAKQIEVIAAHLQDALARGATAHTGGEIEEHGGGSYLKPTVLTGVTHEMKVMTEETFGPVIPVMSFTDADEAVRLANDTRYGLSGAVFGDADEALGVARRIDAGGISINDAALTALVYDGEKSSFNFSGMGGSRMGPAALRRFGRRQAFLISDAQRPDPWWYPHLR
ncbi:MAG TPA: aldehyde dehydrogenase family protein [Actinomycetota bacterium]|nr:aldehyde dehydrogenase family protein [Actinomycetota bacterium]